MSLNLYYKYAEIDLTTRECFGVRTTTREIVNEALIPIEVESYDYVGKYYIDGVWYEDAAGTIVWPEPTE